MTSRRGLAGPVRPRAPDAPFPQADPARAAPGPGGRRERSGGPVEYDSATARRAARGHGDSDDAPARHAGPHPTRPAPARRTRPSRRRAPRIAGPRIVSARRIIVGISGASGIVYGVRMLEALRGAGVQTHLVMTRSAQLTLGYELAMKLSELQALADVVHRNENVGASIASGSFATLGMVVAPCSIRSLSEIATGVTSGLLTRAADVVLKERRRLVLLVRETPLHLGHLRTMTAVTEMGAIVMPPVPAFYTRPASVGDIVDHTVGRALDLFGIDNTLVRRWQESPPSGDPAAKA
ncbi:MAG: UbiX family flavin prenyltransferase [Burkholderiales bacterium]|nr:UbiX family flavin prenyltransferase [Burkholderiales bacterium]